jgi:hypothetical protein
MMDPTQSAASPAGRGTRNRQQTANTNQPQSTSLFDLVDGTGPDPDEGRRRRDDAVRAVSLNTHPAWKLAAERVVRELAATGREFTAETVRERTGHPLASHPNALGALLGAAARRGEIVAVGFVQATRPEAHARILRVWKGTGEVGS